MRTQVPRIYLIRCSDGGDSSISNQNFLNNITCNLKMRQKKYGRGIGAQILMLNITYHRQIKKN